MRLYSPSCQGLAEALLSELRTPAGAPHPFASARADRPSAPGPLKLTTPTRTALMLFWRIPRSRRPRWRSGMAITQSWISLIINSDAFQAALAKRRDEVISPELRATVEERLRTLIVESSKVLHRNLLIRPVPRISPSGRFRSQRKRWGMGRESRRSISIRVSLWPSRPPRRTRRSGWRGERLNMNPAAVGRRAWRTRSP